MEDLNEGYKKVQEKITSTKTYVNLKTKYDDIKHRAGETFDQKKSDVTQTIDKLKEQTSSFQRELKSQFDQLMDINNITGGKGSGSIKYVKNIMTKVLKEIEPQIAEIIQHEALNAVGCDQQQTFSTSPIYIKVKSIDLGNLLKKDPEGKIGRLLYEKRPINIQSTPFSMNRELYQRIKDKGDYQTDNGQLYNGRSGQPLFNIQYVEKDNLNQTGPWFRVDLQNRLTGPNNVGEFMVDYYKSIKVSDFHTNIAWIIESITGALSIEASVGVGSVNDSSKFMLFVQRILGLCFDNSQEIDISGISKLSEYDDIDNSFYELTDIDLRNIEQRTTNIKNGVIEFVSCDNIKLPVDSNSIINSLNDIIFVEGDNQVNAANNVIKTILNNPNWNGLTLNGGIEAELDLNFIKNIVKGLSLSLLSPKILLPIFVMLKAIGQNIGDTINSYTEFIKYFKTFFKNIISKVGAIFVKQLFDLIKKNIKQLIQNVITDIAIEKKQKKVIMILKLVQILITVSQFINDWRKCKSVIDELLWLLKIAKTGWGGEIPLPLLFATQLLDGYSATRAFIGTIEELQKIGIPTGDMPDGSPNLTVLSMFSQIKAQSDELAENGKVQIAIPPLTITPAGLTIPSSGFGKSI